jgi:hypothetical protein
MSTIARHCGHQIEWGFDSVTGRWIPLEPIATHDDLPRTFVDENGVLRADHRDRHRPGSVNVTRLEKKVQPLEAQVIEKGARRHNRQPVTKEGQSAPPGSSGETQLQSP